MVVFMHHQAAWKDPDPAFQDAHVYVHLKAVYILPLEKGRCKGDDRRIGATQEFLHKRGFNSAVRPLSSLALDLQWTPE